MISFLKRNYRNFSGWSTDRRIVVIESDDWGSIRMPSLSTYNYLLKKGYKVDTDPYMKFDSLATVDDLCHLFEVLHKIKDNFGKNPVITANTIVANPDFKKIEDSNFLSFFYEPFTETLSRYKGCETSFKLWNEGLDSKIFFPQFHGREHLNVSQWMLALQNKDKNILEAYDNNMISISSEPSKLKFSYMEGMDFFNNDEYLNRKLILEEGLKLFERIFDYKSLSYIANCYIWDEFVEEIISNFGVKYVQGVRVQKIPKNIGGNHSFTLKSNRLGDINALGQIYLTRNVFFEPSHYSGIDVVDSCLMDIASAFFWKKPAIISSHRLNFIGSIHEKNRIENLQEFQKLLSKIVKKWPDVEFMTSSELGALVEISKYDK